MRLLYKNPIAYACEGKTHKEKEHNIGRAEVCLATLQQIEANYLAGECGNNNNSVQQKTALLGLWLICFGEVIKVYRAKRGENNNRPQVICKIKHRVENNRPKPNCGQRTVKIFHDCSPILKNKLASIVYHKTAFFSRWWGFVCDLRSMQGCYEF